ncbi:MAG TPA: gamma-mobile-trio recombinase GmtY [Thiopseudomonas sp.]|nr:gamma-mobile-trio recombinase GmtY [Thiopseudomonas sp.]
MTTIRVNAKIKIDNTASLLDLPVIVTNGGILKSHLEYLINHRSRSRSWVDRSVFSVRLLLEFWEANQGAVSDAKKMFREFSFSLFTGTIGDDGKDHSGLRWLSRKEADAKQLIGHITHYCDWLAEFNDDQRLSINPKIRPDGIGERMNLAAHYHRKRNAFLSHLWSKQPANNQRAVRLPSSSVIQHQETVKSFPENKMQDLLENGFVRRGMSGSRDIKERLNLRDILITMLMYYGGLRISECFHIWIEDVILVDGKCVVKVYHPSQGLAPDGKTNRIAYLRKKYDLLPRQEYPKRNRLHAGWKDPLLTHHKGKFFTVNWFPLDTGDTFRQLWILYLQYQYVKPLLGEQHPYAFTDVDGRPCSIKAYNDSRKRAVERIGLPFSKEAATTAHADRHSYGLALANAKVRPEVIKVALHHKSIGAQTQYTQPTEKDMRKALASAEVFFRRDIPSWELD